MTRSYPPSSPACPFETLSGGGEHIPVLLREAVDALDIREDGIYVDATFGRGGHARAILQHLSEVGRLLAMDRDPVAVKAAEDLCRRDPRFRVEQGSFERLAEMVGRFGYMGQVNGVLLDLGVSSSQLDDASRGFSFMRDGPLDMRMDPTQGQTAAAWLAQASAEEISRVLHLFGEERFARRIAQTLVQARAQAPILTTRCLADLVAKVIPSREPGKHPATRSFQAIRIHINQELEALQSCLERVLEILAIGGRLVVISFHSLEDRIVKRFMRDQEQDKRFPPDLPVTREQLCSRLRVLGRPIRPNAEEVGANPRARSAILRVAEKTA